MLRFFEKTSGKSRPGPGSRAVRTSSGIPSRALPADPWLTGEERNRDTIMALNIPTFFCAQTIYELATFFLCFTRAIGKQRRAMQACKCKRDLKNGFEIHVIEKNLMNILLLI